MRVEALSTCSGGGSLMHRQSAGAFRTWVSYVEVREAARMVMMRVLGHERVRALRNAGGERVRAGRAAVKLRSRSATCAIGSCHPACGWVDACKQQKAMRVVLRYCFNRRRALRTWQEMAISRGEALRKLRLGLGRWSRARVAAALLRWSDHTQELFVMQRAMARMLDVARARAFSAWSASLHAQRVALEQLRSTVAHMTNRSSREP